MKNQKRRMLSAIIAAACAFTFVSPQTGFYAVRTYAATPASSTHATDAEARENNLATNTVDGTILHAWCWSFKTIKANMKDIAAAGFSTVQTSPANACVNAYPTMKLMGNDQTNGTDGCWWWQYQPTDWTIGNYQLGSEQDFKDMCAEADKYGIKVIVDVIPNHTTPRLNDVSQNLINAAGGGKGVAGGLYHKNGFNKITQWGNRYECTTGEMGGLPDVNTENPGFQDYFVKYLKELVKDGCDGMRYDTAKHIGVPSDPKDEYYWGNNVLGAKGNDEFKSTIVKCANFFRNAMVGQGQAISNPTGNNNLVMIERGSKGVALVNGGGNTSVDVSTKLSDGTYIDTVSRNTFTVQNGKLKGSIGGSTAAFLYKTSSTGGSGNTGDQGKTDSGKTDSGNTGSHTTDTSSVIDGSYNIYFVNNDNWSGDIKAYLYDSNDTNNKNSDWPGVAMTKVGTVNGKDVYATNVPSSLSGKSVKVIFTNGSQQFPAHQGDRDGLDYSSGSYALSSIDASSWKAVEKKTEETGKKDDNTGKTDENSGKTGDDTDGDIFDINYEDIDGDGSDVAEVGDELTTENAVYTVTAVGDKNTVEYSECFVENPKKIVVPDTVTIDGAKYDVTSIGNKAFAKQKTMTAVAIGKNVTSIGNKAFYGCSKLKQVVVNSTALKTVKTSSFRKVNKSVMVLVPKANAKAYRKLFKKAGIKSKNIKAISADQKKNNNTSKDTSTSKNDTGNKSENNTGSNTGNTGNTGDTSGNSQTKGQTTETVKTKLYSTNANGFGSKKTITSPSDFTDSDIIAQGAANDDPRTFRGAHEGPVYDDYALYAAYDDTNLYVGWQYVNVADVSAPEQGYPNSDNGYPDNGDLPQMLAFYVPGQKVSSGNLSGNGGKVWGLNVDFTTPITALACFSSKNTNGTPALFTTGSDGDFNYDANCIGFKKAGISYKSYRGVSLSSHIYGINGNGYTGLTPDQFLDGTGTVVDFNSLGHDKSKDTFYLMTIPLKALGTSASQISSKGLGLMHISTFGASGIGSLPTDPTMYDSATLAYSSDESTSAEKEDVDNVTVPLAYVGKKAS